jgi:hypothetical protein
MSNILRIKRRLVGSESGTTLPVLSNGELAYNEINNVLFYGAQGGTSAIAGSGAFVSLDNAQTITGTKTFTNSTTLSSVTFSADSTIDLGSNKITNLGAPDNDSDAATKKYVDDAATTSGSSVTSLSTTVDTYFVEKTESDKVTLNGGLVVASGAEVNNLTSTGFVNVSGDLTVSGNLTVYGDTTTIETTTTVTSSFTINNYGSTTALVVTQIDGEQSVAEFKDGEDTALIITGEGRVGVGTDDPSHRLTVSGSISATDNIYGTANSSTLYDFIIDAGEF